MACGNQLCASRHEEAARVLQSHRSVALSARCFFCGWCDDNNPRGVCFPFRILLLPCAGCSRKEVLAMNLVPDPSLELLSFLSAERIARSG